MKYMITNGNQYINVLNRKSSATPYVTYDNPQYATRFKLIEAKSFIAKNLGGESKWGIRKVASTRSKKNYVITSGVNYVASTAKGGITADYNDAKWFRSVADADAYLINHRNIFDNAIIVDENGYAAEVDEKRTFTDEQLEFLGAKKVVQREKRIIIPKSTREIVYENGHGVCAICGRPVDIDHFTIDHIVPLARGGKNQVSNYQIACNDCNKLKGSRMNSEFAKSLATILSQQIKENPDNDISDMLIRTIVRSKINVMKAGA